MLLPKARTHRIGDVSQNMELYQYCGVGAQGSQKWDVSSLRDALHHRIWFIPLSIISLLDNTCRNILCQESLQTVSDIYNSCHPAARHKKAEGQPKCTDESLSLIWETGICCRHWSYSHSYVEFPVREVVFFPGSQSNKIKQTMWRVKKESEHSGVLEAV